MAITLIGGGGGGSQFYIDEVTLTVSSYYDYTTGPILAKKTNNGALPLRVLGIRDDSTNVQYAIDLLLRFAGKSSATALEYPQLVTINDLTYVNENDALAVRTPLYYYRDVNYTSTGNPGGTVDSSGKGFPILYRSAWSGSDARSWYKPTSQSGSYPKPSSVILKVLYMIPPSD